MLRICKFLYCCFMGHEWRTLNVPWNKTKKLLAKCERCGHFFYQFGP